MTSSDVAKHSRPPITLKHFRRIAIGAVILLPALYFLPALTIFYLVCGTLDIARQRNVTVELVEKFFLGNGIFTWALSPGAMLVFGIAPTLLFLGVLAWIIWRNRDAKLGGVAARAVGATFGSIGLANFALMAVILLARPQGLFGTTAVIRV